MLDPFRPERPQDLERLKAIQTDVHGAFKRLVETRRGARLRGESGELFSGAVWTGSEALALGLIDGLGDIRGVLRERYGDKVQFRVIPPARSSLLARWFGSKPSPAAWDNSEEASRHLTSI
jgi:ClpP class serine protease